MSDWSETIRWLWAPVSALFAWALWSFKKATASKEDIGRMDARLDRHRRHIDRLETRFDTLPSRDDFHALSQSLVRLDGQYEAIQKTIEIQTQAVKRIEDYLLKHRTL